MAPVIPSNPSTTLATRVGSAIPTEPGTRRNSQSQQPLLRTTPEATKPPPLESAGVYANLASIWHGLCPWDREPPMRKDEQQTVRLNREEPVKDPPEPTASMRPAEGESSKRSFNLCGSQSQLVLFGPEVVGWSVHFTEPASRADRQTASRSGNSACLRSLPASLLLRLPTSQPAKSKASLPSRELPAFSRSLPAKRCLRLSNSWRANRSMSLKLRTRTELRSLSSASRCLYGLRFAPHRRERRSLPPRPPDASTASHGLRAPPQKGPIPPRLPSQPPRALPLCLSSGQSLPMLGGKLKSLLPASPISMLPGQSATPGKLSASRDPPPGPFCKPGL